MRTINKAFAGALILTLLMITPPLITRATTPINVTVDGVPVIFPDQQPVVIDGHTLVPVYGVFTQMGFTADWDGRTRTATLTSPDYTVIIAAGEATFTVNGETITPDMPQRIIGGRLMLPLRAVAEAVGGTVTWVTSTRTAAITSGVAAVHPLVGAWGRTENSEALFVFHENGAGWRDSWNPRLQTFEWIMVGDDLLIVDFLGRFETNRYSPFFGSWNICFAGGFLTIQETGWPGTSHVLTRTSYYPPEAAKPSQTREVWPSIQSTISQDVSDALVGTWVRDQRYADSHFTFNADNTGQSGGQSHRIFLEWFVFDDILITMSISSCGTFRSPHKHYISLAGDIVFFSFLEGYVVRYVRHSQEIPFSPSVAPCTVPPRGHPLIGQWEWRIEGSYRPYFNFYADGTGTHGSHSSISAFTWRVEGDYLYFVYSEFFKRGMRIVIDGNRFTLSHPYEEYIISFANVMWFTPRYRAFYFYRV